MAWRFATSALVVGGWAVCAHGAVQHAHTAPRDCRSWSLDEENCGTLEFLGDAVLGLVVTSYLFYRLGADTRKSLTPGQLSDLRSSIVKNDCLAIMACVRRLDACLLHNSPALYQSISTFRQVRSKRAAVCAVECPFWSHAC